MRAVSDDEPAVASASRFAPIARDGAVLNDVDAALVGPARVAPSDGVVASGSAARLIQSPLDGKACVVEVEKRQHLANRLAIEQLRVDVMQPHRIAAPRVGVALRVGVAEVEHAALADHGVEVQLPLESLP